MVGGGAARPGIFPLSPSTSNGLAGKTRTHVRVLATDFNVFVVRAHSSLASASFKGHNSPDGADAPMIGGAECCCPVPSV